MLINSINSNFLSVNGTWNTGFLKVLSVKQGQTAEQTPGQPAEEKPGAADDTDKQTTETDKQTTETETEKKESGDKENTGTGNNGSG